MTRINRNNLEIYRVCDKRSLNKSIKGVHFGDDYSEATDSYMLVRVDKVKGDDGDEGFDPKGLTLEADDVEAIRYFPSCGGTEGSIRRQVVMSTSESEIRCTTTDGTDENIKTKVTICHKVDGTYPNTDQLIFGDIEGGGTATMSLLRKFIAVIAKLNIMDDKVKIKIADGNKLLIQGRTWEGQEIRAILMLQVDPVN